MFVWGAPPSPPFLTSLSCPALPLSFPSLQPLLFHFLLPSTNPFPFCYPFTGKRRGWGHPLPEKMKFFCASWHTEMVWKCVCFRSQYRTFNGAPLTSEVFTGASLPALSTTTPQSIFTVCLFSPKKKDKLRDWWQSWRWRRLRRSTVSGSGSTPRVRAPTT